MNNAVDNILSPFYNVIFKILLLWYNIFVINLILLIKHLKFKLFERELCIDGYNELSWLVNAFTWMQVIFILVK